MLPALRIPGAQIEYVRVDGERVDPDWYRFDAASETLHWNRESQPKAATISIALTQALTTKEDAAELTAKWKKLAIVLPFVLGLVGIFVGQFGKEKAVEKTAAVGPAPVVAPASAPGESRYESWTVDGCVKVDKSKFAAFNIYIKASPPRLSLDGGASCSTRFPWR